MNEIIFVSKNKQKYEELKEIFKSEGMKLDCHYMDIEELQTSDYNKLIRDKVLKAYKKVRRPVLVEHTMLCMEAFGGMPDAGTQPFFDKLQADGICDICRKRNNYRAYVCTVLGYCDGKTITVKTEKMNGWIRRKPVNEMKGYQAFGWDTIFIPSNTRKNPGKKTFYELSVNKNKISMRTIAAKKLINYLRISGIDTTSGKKLERTYQNSVNEIADLIKQSKLMLFIGAGISNSLGLPTWKELISKLGIDLGYDRDVFECYGDYLLLAEYYAEQKNRQELHRKLRDCMEVNETQVANNQIYKMIVELDVPVIYTTNYDNAIETAYKVFAKKTIRPVKSMTDFENINRQQPQIVKFHGDLTDENSIVLTETQYFERMDFDSLLDLQLQVDWAKYSVLYLGYSLSDMNIKLMLYRANRKKKMLGGNVAPSYIFTATPNQIQESVFRENGITAFSNYIVDKQKATEKFLEDLCINVRSRA